MSAVGPMPTPKRHSHVIRECQLQQQEGGKGCGQRRIRALLLIADGRLQSSRGERKILLYPDDRLIEQPLRLGAIGEAAGSDDVGDHGDGHEISITLIS